jgi:hypothetical protein
VRVGFIFCFFISFLLFAKDPPNDPYAAYNDRVKIGWEIEIENQQIAHLFRNKVFDIDHFEKAVRKNLGQFALKEPELNEILNSYLDTPGALESLPQSIRSKILSAEINTDSPSLTVFENKVWVPIKNKVNTAYQSTGDGNILVQNQSISDSTNKIIIGEHEIQSGNTELVTNNIGNKFSENFTVKDVGSSSKNDWKLIKKRWNELSFSEKWKAIEFKNLSSLTLAKFVEHLPLEQKKSTKDYLVVDEQNAPSWAKKVNFSVDGLAKEIDHVVQYDGIAPRSGWSLEISWNGTMAKPKEYVDTIKQVSKDIGASSQILNPTLMKRSSLSFHEHFSVKDEKSQKIIPDFEKRIMAYRKWLLIKLLSAGGHYDSLLTVPEGHEGRKLQNIYDNDIGKKHNMARMVDSYSHFEIKEHFASPEEEIQHKLDLMFKSTSELLDQYDQDIQKMIKKDPAIIGRIAHINPSLLSDFTKFTDPQMNTTLAKKSLSLELSTKEEYVEKTLPKLWRFFSNSRHVSSDLYLVALDELKLHPTFLKRNAEGSLEAVKHNLDEILLFYVNYHADKLAYESPDSFSRLLKEISGHLLKNPEILDIRPVTTLLERIVKVDPGFLDQFANRMISLVGNHPNNEFTDKNFKILNWLMKKHFSNDQVLKEKIASLVKTQILKKGHLTNINTVHALNLLTTVDPQTKMNTPQVKSQLRQTIVHYDKDIRDLTLEAIKQHIPEEVPYLRGDQSSKYILERDFLEMAMAVGERDVRGRVGKYPGHGQKELLDFADIRDPNYYYQLENALKNAPGLPVNNPTQIGSHAGNVQSEFVAQQYLKIAENSEKASVKQFLLSKALAYYSKSDTVPTESEIQKIEKLLGQIDALPDNDKNAYLIDPAKAFLKKLKIEPVEIISPLKSSPSTPSTDDCQKKFGNLFKRFFQ